MASTTRKPPPASPGTPAPESPRHPGGRLASATDMVGGSSAPYPDGVVDVSDLLILLGTWGPCPGQPGSPGLPIEALLEEAGLSEEDWDAYVAVMTGDDEREKEIWNCWMQIYLMMCQNCPSCPGPDPFAS